MDRRTELEFARLKGARDRRADETRAIDIEIGKLAAITLDTDKYASKSGIGRLLGVSHTTVSNLMAIADQAELPSPPALGLPIFPNRLASEYVVERGARILRSISAFDEGDALFQSNLDPRLFADPERGSLQLPAMLWQLDSGEWVGVDEATVGYGGAGCDMSRNALVEAGVDKQIADEIVSWRFCDAVNIDDPATWQKNTIWPVHSRGIPSVVGTMIVVDFGEGLQRIRSWNEFPQPWRPEIDQSGFYPSVTPQTSLEAWISFLDGDDLPTWAQGPRVARVFITSDEAENQGFVRRAESYGISYGQKSIPTLVIEQGDVQLWGHFYPDEDRSQLLPSAAYESLAIAGVYPTELAERDQRNARPWSRFLHAIAGADRNLPPAIDVSHTGTDHLRHTPATEVHLSTD